MMAPPSMPFMRGGGGGGGGGQAQGFGGGMPFMRGGGGGGGGNQQGFGGGVPFMRGGGGGQPDASGGLMTGGGYSQAMQQESGQLSGSGWMRGGDPAAARSYSGWRGQEEGEQQAGPGVWGERYQGTHFPVEPRFVNTNISHLVFNDKPWVSKQQCLLLRTACRRCCPPPARSLALCPRFGVSS